MADDTSPRTPSFSAKSSTISSARLLVPVTPSSFSTPVLCPRSPLTPIDSLRTTFGKRHRETSPSFQEKRYKTDSSSPRLCIELYKLESRVLFPCYIEKDLVKTGWLPFREREEGECEAVESDEEAVVQSQGLLSSQLERSLQEELAKECTDFS